MVLDRQGNLVLNYRKILLFDTDKRYFHPGCPDQPRSFDLITTLGKTLKTSVAICMDINYKNFLDFYEFPLAWYLTDNKIEVLLFMTA